MHYLEETRGLSRKLLDRLRVGVVPVSDSILRCRSIARALRAIGWVGDDDSVGRQWQNRVAFPALDANNHVTNFHLRVLPKTRSPGRWSSVPRQEALPFFPWQIDPAAPWWTSPPATEVVITEGIIDACRVEQAGLPASVAILGTAHPVLPFLIQLAERPGIRRVTSMLDFNDGGRRATIHLISQIQASGATFPFELRFATGLALNAEDPGEATDAELHHAFFSATPARQWLRDIMEASLDVTDAWQRRALESFLLRHSPP